MRPRILFAPLSETIQVVTRWREEPGVRPGSVVIVASRKYEATSDIEYLFGRDWRKKLHRRVRPKAPPR
jgi:hypothetical protein